MNFLESSPDTEFSNVIGDCGVYPIFGSRAKKDAWNACHAQALQNKSEGKTQDTQMTNALINALNAPTPASSGMSTGAIIGITFGVLVLVGGITFAIVKFAKK